MNKIELFNPFFTCWNRFCHNDSDSNDDFGSKQSINRWFESHLKRYLAWGRLDRISLNLSDQPRKKFSIHRPVEGGFWGHLRNFHQAWANYLIEKNYSKKFDIHFGIWYTKWMEPGQPIRFACKRNTFYKSNNVKYC